MPGMFVSNGKEWKPAEIIPRGPSHDRMGVTPGDPLLDHAIPDPAAVKFIKEQEGESATVLPASPYKADPLTEMAQKMTSNTDTTALQAQLADMAKQIAELKAVKADGEAKPKK